MLNCRRCGSVELLELARLAGADHTVYRCRECGFLFSPPEGETRASRAEPSPLRPREEVLRRRAQRAAWAAEREPTFNRSGV